MGRSRTTPVEEDDDGVELSEEELGRRHEVLGILTGAATVLFAMALCSYDARGGENWIGPVGAGIASVFAAALGVAAWVIPAELTFVTIRLFRRTGTPLGVARAASAVVIVLVGCALMHLALTGQQVFGGHLPGGVLGEVLGELLRSLLGLAGAFVVGIAVLLVTLVLRTSLSIVALGRHAADATGKASSGALTGARSLWDAWREARRIEREEREARARELEPKIITPACDADADADADAGGDSAGDERGAAATLGPDTQNDAVVATGGARGEALLGQDGLHGESLDDDVSAPKPAKPPARRGTKGPVIVAPTSSTQPKRGIKMDRPPEPGANTPYLLPPTSLLDLPKQEAIQIDEKTLKDNAARLEEKLAAYGVQGRVDEIHPGPVVTMYELEPASGTKVSKIASLAEDLALALAAEKVRIVAPIPGKARVGFELPNKKRQTVSAREILEDERWREMRAALPMALGKDIAGEPVFVDLAKMPHLLVAGATGAGKSVGINVMLASLLYKKTPDEVRLLMIDPKVVELAVFDGIPHMLLPVVTDMKKASLALRWAVDEMERRYQLFADAGARSVITYNERVDKVLSGEMPAEKLAPGRAGKVRAQGPHGEEVLVDPDEGETANAVVAMPKKLPYIVVVVDEFADLMMVAAKDVESAIARLAQKARAAGIHVILATQRPSVDVITGMIKANFPARIAFKVSQKEDSKTILGRMGAERLLGMGDMLMIPPGSSDLKRVHCAYIGEHEVQAVCDFLRAQGTPVYDEEILRPRDDESGEGGEGGAFGEPSDDPLFDRAVALVAQARSCSISQLQRHLKVGYNKAATLVERMEREGVVGPASAKAGGRREVLVQPL